MATDGNDEIQEQMREWMEAAQKPQAPLTNAELKKLRLHIDQAEKNAWLRKRIYIALPWITTLLVSIGAGWKGLVEWITGHK